MSAEQPARLSLADLRRNYTLAGLLEDEVDADGIVQAIRWLEAAVAAGVPEPSAATLATVTPDGLPAARTVLVKGADERGFVFYTNYESQKGRDLAARPHATIVFYWAQLERQVRISGTVGKTSIAESEQYFLSRPLGSRLGAWVSRQSAVIAGRSELEADLARLTEHYGETVPLPPFWGGYRVTPSMIELWQGRPNRLHDRLRYTRVGDGPWRLERLAP